MKITGHGGAAQVELVLHLEPAHARHAHVEHQAARLRSVVARQEFLRRRVGLAGYACRLEQQAQRVAHRVVVIDHEHGLRQVFHRGVSRCAGSTK